MRRRVVLAAAGATCSLSVVGCLEAVEGRAGLGDELETEAPNGSAANESDTNSDTETGSHHLYLCNLGEESRRVSLGVVDRDRGEPVLEDTYELPDERGGEFRAVAGWGRTYEVTATLASGRSETFCWDIEHCPGPETEDDEAELPGGSRNGSVRIEPDGDRLSFVTDSCDEIVAGTAVATGPTGQFAVEETD